MPVVATQQRIVVPAESAVVRFDLGPVLLVGPRSDSLLDARRDLERSGVHVERCQDLERALRVLAVRQDFAAVVLVGKEARSPDRLRERGCPLGPWPAWLLVRESWDDSLPSRRHDGERFYYLTPPLLAEELRAIARTAHALAHRRACQQLALGRAIAGAYLVAQPIVTLRDRNVVARELLLRTSESEWSGPQELIAAAVRRGRALELGRRARDLAASLIEQRRAPAPLFVNLGVDDVLDDDLYDPASRFTRCARSVVVELAEHDRTFAIPDLDHRIRSLRRLGFRVALDDLDSGHHGLGMLARSVPDFAKVDRSLIQGVDADPGKQRVLRSILRCAQGFGSRVICEGVETEAEAATLERLGVSLAQGYWFGRPAAIPARAGVTRCRQRTPLLD